MSWASMSEALPALRLQTGRSVQEREILRIAASLEGEPGSAAEQSRREALVWAQRRSGGRLPEDAWSFASFEMLAAGRTSMAVRLVNDEADFWALRAEDPDKSVAGRVWTTEITIGFRIGEPARFGLRLLASSTEAVLDIEPHSPGVVRQIVDTCGLLDREHRLSSVPVVVDSDAAVADLISLIEDPDRRLPVFVASGDERSAEPGEAIIDTAKLAAATVGLAHVFTVPAWRTYELTDVFGRLLSVYHGAVRSYMPGFSILSDPYLHRLFLGDSLKLEGSADRCVTSLRSIAASESVRRVRLGRDVLPFLSVRSAALAAGLEQAQADSAGDAEQLAKARKRIDALEAELAQARETIEIAYQFQEDAEARAETAEKQAGASAYQFQSLLEALKSEGREPSKPVELPMAWSEFGDWCNNALAGRVALSPTAVRQIRSPQCEVVADAARALSWLAEVYRENRINGSGEPDGALGGGLHNTRCGADSFDFDWRGQRLTADWHIKNGGNTRDPLRCLRIYYTWEPNARQVVIAEMPAHRHTGAT